MLKNSYFISKLNNIFELFLLFVYNKFVIIFNYNNNNNDIVFGDSVLYSVCFISLESAYTFWIFA